MMIHLESVVVEMELNTGKRTRPSTSPVSDDFEKLFKIVKGKKVTYAARCLHCSKQYTARSSGGTGHLSLHIASCVERLEKSHMTQT